MKIKIPLFKFSIEKIEDGIIGYLYDSVNRNNNSTVRDLLKIENKEYIHLDYYPMNMTVLPNNRLLIINLLHYYPSDITQCITLHDENYKVIKKIEKINGQIIYNVLDIVINQEKRELYLSDRQNNRIIVTDYELNFIKYFGSEGQFNKPMGLSFNKENLYVCDYSNGRIQQFNKNLKHVNSIKFNNHPCRLKISNSVLVVSSANCVESYDLKSMKVLETFKHDRRFALDINEIDSNFYGVDTIAKKVVCFDQKGKFIEKINLTENDLCDGKLILFNQTLLMSSCLGKKLIKFR